MEGSRGMFREPHKHSWAMGHIGEFIAFVCINIYSGGVYGAQACIIEKT
jgi:hypothetical protein